MCGTPRRIAAKGSPVSLDRMGKGRNWTTRMRTAVAGAREIGEQGTVRDSAQRNFLFLFKHERADHAGFPRGNDRARGYRENR